MSLRLIINNKFDTVYLNLSVHLNLSCGEKLLFEYWCPVCVCWFLIDLASLECMENIFKFLSLNTVICLLSNVYNFGAIARKILK